MLSGKDNFLLRNKKVLISLSAVAIVGAAAIGTTSVFAQANNGQNSLISELAQKLGVDQSKVQTAFDQIKDEHHVNRSRNIENRLNQLVQNGKITSSQKTAIEQKMSDIKNYLNSDGFKNMSPSDKKQALMQLQTDTKNWAQSQGLDLTQIPLFKIGMGMGMGGFEKGFKMGWRAHSK